MPQLVRIAIHPIKSLDPVEVHEARVLPSGALENDRRFAIFDEKGRVVNGKREPRIHRIRARYNLSRMTVVLSACGMEEQEFSLVRERDEIGRWLTRFLGYTVALREDATRGFPDDLEATGPTIISTGTLLEVAGWFPGMSLGDARLRFRANLEVGAWEAFWEERVFTGGPRCIRVGEVVFRPTGISRRCVVPSRDPFTGSVLRGFQKTFAERRIGSLPEGFRDNPYRLALNTVVVRGAGSVLRLFDEVELTEC